MLICLSNYELCCTQPLKLLLVMQTCSEFYWYTCFSLGHCMPLGVVHKYQSNVSLPCYNILITALYMPKFMYPHNQTACHLNLHRLTRFTCTCTAVINKYLNFLFLCNTSTGINRGLIGLKVTITHCAI